MSTELEHVKLSFDEARQITEEIKSNVESVWLLLKKAHDGKAWAALGFPTWEEYVKQEFKMSRRRSYELVNFAKVQENLCGLPHKPETEGQANALTALKEPERQREAWTQAVETSGGKPTAKDVEAAVEVVKASGIAAATEKAPPFVPSFGLQYAAMAINDLEKI